MDRMGVQYVGKFPLLDEGMFRLVAIEEKKWCRFITPPSLLYLARADCSCAAHQSTGMATNLGSW